MRRTGTMLSVFLLLFSLSAFAQAPRLEEPTLVRLFDGTPIDVGNMGFASVGYHDMTRDGVPDLLVGELANGGLRIYRNSGTATAPIFTGFSLLSINREIANAHPG